MTVVLRNRRLTFLVACCAALVVLAAGCGGGSGSSSGVPNGDVAVVNGQPVTEPQLQTIVDQSIESFKVNKQPVPKPGSDQYKALQQRLVTYLVTKAEFEQEAKRMHVTVKPSEIDAELKKFIKQYFKGSEKSYRAALKKQHVTDAQVRQNISFTVLENDLMKKATAGITVTEDEAHNYYIAHAPNYSKPQTRHVAHILVKTKKLADKIYAQLKQGSSFAALAKKYTIDTGSKPKGGDLGPISKGQ